MSKHVFPIPIYAFCLSVGTTSSLCPVEVFEVVSFFSLSCHNLVHVCLSLFPLRAPCHVHLTLLVSILLIVFREEYKPHKFPHYVIFSSLLLLPLSLAHMTSFVPYSRVLSMYVLFLSVLLQVPGRINRSSVMKFHNKPWSHYFI